MEVGGGGGATGQVKEQSCLQGAGPQWGKQASDTYMEEGAGIWSLGSGVEQEFLGAGQIRFLRGCGAESAVLSGQG